MWRRVCTKVAMHTWGPGCCSVDDGGLNSSSNDIIDLNSICVLAVWSFRMRQSSSFSAVSLYWISLEEDPNREPTPLSIGMFPVFDSDDKPPLDENTMSFPSIPIDSTKGPDERSTEIAVRLEISLQTAPFELHFGSKILLERWLSHRYIFKHWLPKILQGTHHILLNSTRQLS